MFSCKILPFEAKGLVILVCTWDVIQLVSAYKHNSLLVKGLWRGRGGGGTMQSHALNRERIGQKWNPIIKKNVVLNIAHTLPKL